MRSRHANPGGSAPRSGFLAGYSVEGWAWLAAVVLWVVGDVLTTLVGLSFPGVVEVSPTGQLVLESVGPVGLVLAKLLFVAGLYYLSRVVPRSWRVGVPIGLFVVGLVAVIWNLYVIILVA